MKWRGRRGSRNIEDRRGVSKRKAAGGMGLGGVVVVLLLGMVFGVDVTPFLNGGTGNAPVTNSAPLTQADRDQGQFVSVTLADTEEVWAEIFREQLGRAYRPVTLVLFKGVTRSPCGNASGATGPFYCPADKKAYLDTDFFTTMANRMGAKGDFASAYVVAHEVAHHVQNELGILGKANAARSRMSTKDSNRVSVMIELQADCYSGVWARRVEQKFRSVDPDDLREAINAAKQIGDDTLQRNAGRRPMPHTYTHGTSEQRQQWFIRGYKTNDIQQCDTFAALN